MMNKMRSAAYAVCKNVGAKVRGGLYRKSRGDSQVIVAVLLILLAVALVVLFREQIITKIQQVINSISGKIDSLIS